MSYRNKLRDNLYADIRDILVSWNNSSKKYDDFIKHYENLFDLIRIVNIKKSNIVIIDFFWGIAYFIIFLIILTNTFPYDYSINDRIFIFTFLLSTTFAYLYYRNRLNMDNDAIKEYITEVKRELTKMQNEFLKIQEKRINKLEQFADKTSKQLFFNNYNL
ncbi:hypothetical protein CDQ71_00130 [Campylobacter hyointestinalis subsp. hyointestinalis]|uniref:hypothetical protein n=1 Tax=Campylobacter hyointestinalis TaxID=198 RepID=UPI000CE3CEAB|nr:hypothetical protein [Campylobacter hyointestinalis]PPB58740.1 hypothetical protein CDQ71_00130 [Campylobacter hyointestinalis subsp. hyointestinalis]TWO20729.1 hypothetical protein YZ80_05895 [Campylobacter hyointestinalis]